MLKRTNRLNKIEEQQLLNAACQKETFKLRNNFKFYNALQSTVIKNLVSVLI
jgi:hypothetical protein